MPDNLLANVGDWTVSNICMGMNACGAGKPFCVEAATKAGAGGMFVKRSDTDDKAKFAYQPGNKYGIKAATDAALACPVPAIHPPPDSPTTEQLPTPQPQIQ